MQYTIRAIETLATHPYDYTPGESGTTKYKDRTGSISITSAFVTEV